LQAAARSLRTHLPTNPLAGNSTMDQAAKNEATAVLIADARKKAIAEGYKRELGLRRTTITNHRMGWTGLAQNPTVNEHVRLPTVIQFDDPRFSNDIYEPDKLSQIVEKKITSFARAASVEKNSTYRAFLRSGSKKGKPIPKNLFRKRLQQWGIRPTDVCYDLWWEKVDENGDGDLDFNEFFHFAMPKDYNTNNAHIYKIARGFLEKPGTTQNDIFLASKGALMKRRDKEDVIFRQLDEKGAGVKELNVEEIIDVIKNKIRERTKADASQMTEAFKLFGQPRGGITKSVFKLKLNQWGIHMKTATLDEVFSCFDGDGNGVVDFNEFLSFVGFDDGSHPLHGEKENKVFYQKVRSRLFKEAPKMKGTQGMGGAKRRFAASALRKRGGGVTSAFRKLWDVLLRGHCVQNGVVAAVDLKQMFTGKLDQCGYQPCMSIKAFRGLLTKLNIDLRAYQVQDLVDAYLKTTHPTTFVQCDLFKREAIAWQKTQKSKRPMTPQRPMSGRLNAISAAQRAERQMYSRGGRQPAINAAKFGSQTSRPLTGYSRPGTGCSSRPATSRSKQGLPNLGGDDGNFLLMSPMASPIRPPSRQPHQQLLQPLGERDE